MRKSTIAALLSACVLPGSGHIYLRSYARGIALLGISAAALVDFVHRVWQEAALIRGQLMAEINAGGGGDIETLIAHAMSTVDRIDRQPFTIATLVLSACWLIGILDSYRLGKRFEETSPSP